MIGEQHGSNEAWQIKQWWLRCAWKWMACGCKCLQNEGRNAEEGEEPRWIEVWERICSASVELLQSIRRFGSGQREEAADGRALPVAVHRNTWCEARHMAERGFESEEERAARRGPGHEDHDVGWGPRGPRVIFKTIFVINKCRELSSLKNCGDPKPNFVGVQTAWVAERWADEEQEFTTQKLVKAHEKMTGVTGKY